MNITEEHYTRRSFLTVYNSPVEHTVIDIEGRPNGWGSYTEAWNYIYANRSTLPPNVSVVQMYKPTAACKRTPGGVRELLGVV